MNQHAVYVVDRLPDDAPTSEDGFPTYAGHEMAAGPGPLVAVVDEHAVPLYDPMPLWDISVRAHGTVTRAQLVAALLALAGAVESGKMPAPAEAAGHPLGGVITLRPDDAPTVESDK
jgi:hypothetical protein